MDKRKTLENLVAGIKAQLIDAEVIIKDNNLPTSVDFLVISEEANNLNTYKRGELLFDILKSIFKEEYVNHLFVGVLISRADYLKITNESSDGEFLPTADDMGGAAKSI